MSSEKKLSAAALARRGGNVEEDRVFLGLRKRQRCKLCEQEFFIDELPGAISYKSVLDLRKMYDSASLFLV